MAELVVGIIVVLAIAGPLIWFFEIDNGGNGSSSCPPHDGAGGDFGRSDGGHGDGGDGGGD
ncbi:hypothetical protein [Streptomyces sp. RFCAC02]|uniref:hypothetical protein n=1 Tax=Streptomyces sp. RFCAC02 TaxID=2499143 RepID=UPI0010203B47|nr:hypothetical protein [Streptomyces sp. RFCAC02]